MIKYADGVNHSAMCIALTSKLQRERVASELGYRDISFLLRLADGSECWHFSVLFAEDVVEIFDRFDEARTQLRLGLPA